MESVIATDHSMLLDKFKHLLGDTGVGTDVAAIHVPVAQLCHPCVLGWHDANGDLRRLTEVQTMECNRRNRPTPQSLPGFLAQALEEPISIILLPQRSFRSRSVQESRSLTRSPHRRPRAACLVR
jgi:hypothetical protein